MAEKNKISAYCGLDCANCDAYIATATNDASLREKVAADWSRLYHVEVNPDAINCTGCASSGQKIDYCANKCRVRACCREKGFTTCAPCDDYPCDNLREMFAFSPDAKEKLDRLRQG